MNLSAPFIWRPVGTTLLTAAVALAGIIGYLALPVAPLPQVDFPTININANLPGASAQIMAASVATPLERQFSHIAGITEMTSSSQLGNTSITLQFDLNRDIDGAARDVQAAINAARTYLPTNLPSNPRYRKVNPSDAPVMELALSSNQYDVTKLYDLASNIIMQRLSQIPGVGQVGVQGGAQPAVRIEVNPNKLESFGLTLNNVRSTVSLQNSHSPRGQLSNGTKTLDILDNNQISTAADYAPLVVGYKNGAAIRLSDVADVVDSTQNVRNAGYLDGHHAIFVQIFRQPQANIIETVDRIRAALPFIKATLPLGIETSVVQDRTTTIQASVRDVEKTMLRSIGLVILVVFFFLRSPRATLIPMVAVPVSLIGTFAAMYILGYTLDNLSLMALTVGTGFVVDDAIVVMENITRYIEAGMEPFPAALKGAGEIGFTVFSISISLMAVFIPIVLMGGIIGRLFREFAVTLSIAIAISMVISLTTTPCMCAHLLKRQKEGEKHNFLYRLSDGFFTGMLKVYKSSLTWALDNSVLILIVLALTVALNVIIVFKIPKGFFPRQDTGTIQGGMLGPQDSSFPFMRQSSLALVDVIRRDPAIAHVIVFTGQGNGGGISITLKPIGTSCKESPKCDVRQTSATDVINRLRPQMSRLPVASAFLQPTQDIRIGGRGSNSLYQYTIEADDIDTLNKWGPILLQHMKQLPGLQDVNSDQQNGGLDEVLTYNRTEAARLGQTPQTLNTALSSAFAQSQVSVIYKPLNQYYVVLEVGPDYWQDPSGLNSIYISTGAAGAGGKAGMNKMTPLLSVATPKVGTTPLQVNHTHLFPSATVSFNTANNMSLSDATREVTEMESSLGMPSSVHGSFAGTAQAYQQSLSSEPILVITALLAVFIVLGILYESLIHPFTIISTIFSASVGAMLALMVFHQDLNVISIIGIILLIGLVKKNAIMMIDFAIQAERLGKSTRDSIYEACILRFRPIMMTTMAAIFGALPLALGTGTGSELRKPLGLTIVGGLLLSQMLTLFTTPIVYLTMDRLRLWLRAVGKSSDALSQAPQETVS